MFKVIQSDYIAIKFVHLQKGYNQIELIPEVGLLQDKVELEIEDLT